MNQTENLNTIDTITAQAQLNFKEYLRLNFLLLLRSKMVWLSVVLAVLLVIMLVEKRITEGEWANSEIKIGLLFTLVVFLFLFLPVLRYLRTKKYFENTPSLSEPTTFYFNREGIEVVTSDSHAKLSWRRVYKIREFRHYLLIYQNRHIAYLVPKKAFASEKDLEQVKELIRTKTKLGYRLH